MKNKKGKFFVLEGMDGSGKATQTKLLVEALKKKGHKVQKVDFPQYTKASAAMIENYLRGAYGSSESVGPYRGSIFYAIDRYDLSFQIKKWLEEGVIVVADRYVASNIGHQGGKLIQNKKGWNKYIDWLHHLEYELFTIPKPDYTLILKISPELSMQNSNKITDKEKQKKRASYLGSSKKQDIHEADRMHLANTLKSYQSIQKKYPAQYRIIECEENGKFLPLEVIHQKILKLVHEKI
jgi:dTMP kinase